MADVTKQTKLTRFYDDFYRPLMLRGGTKGTDELYGGTIRHLSRFLKRDATIADFTDDTLARYASHRRQLGRAVATVNGELAKLKALWNFAAKRGITKTWPTIEDEPEPRRVPVAWMPDEMERLWRACTTVKGYVGDATMAEFFTALSLVLWDTPERIGAVMQVRWTDLDPVGRWLLVRAELRKGHVKEELYQLHPDTVAAVMRLKRYGQKYIFSWPKHPQYLWKVWKKILESAGLPSDRRSMFHRMRRSVASHGKAAGLNAQELLDHDSPATTRLYLDPRIAKRMHASDVLFRPGTAPLGN